MLWTLDTQLSDSRLFILDVTESVNCVVPVFPLLLSDVFEPSNKRRITAHGDKEDQLLRIIST